MTKRPSTVFCPYCKEAIKPDAIKCRYCGSMLQNSVPIPANNPSDSLTFIKNAFKGKYEIIKLIGKGGMASVYKAKQISLGRIVALKVIHPNLIHDQEFVDRFLLEARVCASLSHPNIINIYDFGEAQGIYYMGMELLEGNDIAAIINKEKRIKHQTATGYLAPIAHALLYIHSKGYMHRDVKSSNIFITKDGRPVLMDFGIAFDSGGKALTVVGTLLGTPQFLSPEQAMGSKATPESDYYGLGIVLYECITGKVPFNDPNPMVVINKVIKENPVSPGVINKEIPHEVSELTMSLLSKDPGNRPQAINSLLQILYDKKNKQNNSIPFLNKPAIKAPVSKITKLQFNHNANNTKALKLILLTMIFVFLIVLLGGIVFYIGKAINTTDQILSVQQTAAETQTKQDSERTGSSMAELATRNETTRISHHPAVLLIEEQMVDFKEYKIMQTYITNKIWRMITQGDSNGDNHPTRQLSYNEVENFINMLNNLPNNSYKYELPTIELIVNGLSSNIVTQVRSEWVADPPVFAGVRRDGFAKYFINNHQFNYEAGIERNKKHSNIYLRLIRAKKE